MLTVFVTLQAIQSSGLTGLWLSNRCVALGNIVSEKTAIEVCFNTFYI